MASEKGLRAQPERPAPDGDIQFRHVMDAVPVGLAYFDSEQRLQFANLKSEALTGQSRDDLIGMTLAAIIGAKPYRIAKPYVERALLGDSVSFENTLFPRHGGSVTVAVSYTPNVGPDGTVLGFSAVVEDITERQGSEEVLHESELQFRNLFENSGVSIWNEDFSEVYGTLNQLRQDGVKDLRQYLEENQDAALGMAAMVKVTRVNQATLKLLGADTEKAFIASIDEVFGPDAIDVFTDELCAIWERRKSFRAEAAHKTLGGEELTVIISMPITGGIAHDFNNLMAIMIGNAEALVDRVGDDGEAKQSIEAIISAVERGASLTNRLLAFSRKQALSPVAVNVTKLIRGLEDMLQRTLGETVDLSVEETTGLWPAVVDPHRFENALVNLAVNARDAMPNGGRLVIEAANATLDETSAEQHDEVIPGDYVMVAVRDIGTGIPPEILEKVFEPFFTTKEVGHGSGLGLSMIYGFAKQSGGHVTISSEVGDGTTVTLYLPRAIETEAWEGPKSSTAEPAGGSERILVVEDDEYVRAVPARILRKYGYAVVEAMDGKQAIGHLRSGQPFDLLFTDVVLPGGMSGIDIAGEAKRLQPGIKVLLTSGYAERDVAHQGTLDAGVTVLRKPYLPAKLLEKVRHSIDAEDT